MRETVLCVTLVLTIATSPPARAEEPLDAELTRLTEAWNKAWLEKDVAAIERLMAPRYAYVAPGGQVLDRAGALDIARSPGYRPERGTRTEVRVTSLGTDTAAVLHRWQGSGTYEGNAYTDDHRCTLVCARRRGAWVVAWEQCAANVPSAPAAEASAAEATVRQLEAQRIQAMLNTDVAALGRMLSPELTYMHSNGVLDTRETFLASLSSGKLKYRAFDESDVRIRVYGDAAIVTGRAAARVQSGGEELVIDLALTAVYARAKDGAWRLVAWQTTRLPVRP